jgi:hypothetical protein
LPRKKIVLYAQPTDEYPFVVKKLLKEQEYEETDALFGALPFTDVGEEAWRALKSTDKDASIKLVKAAFRGVPWTILFYTDNLKAVLTCQRYTTGDIPKCLYIELKVDGEKKVMQRFVRRLMARLDTKPWKMTDWDDFEEETGKDMKKVITAWKKYSEKPQTSKKKKLPEKIETEMEIEYKQDQIVLKAKVINQTSKTLKDLRFTLKGDKEKLEAESWEQGIPRLNSTGTYTAMFKLRPKTVLKDEELKPVLRYNDGKKKKRVITPVLVTVAPPEVKGKPIKRDDLDALMNKYSKKEETGRFLRRPAADLFNDLVDELGEKGLFMLEPEVERRGSTYIGTLDLYGLDENDVQYILRIKTQGDMRESRVIRTLYSSDPEKIVGFKQLVEGWSVFDKLFDRPKV